MQTGPVFCAGPFTAGFSFKIISPDFIVLLATKYLPKVSLFSTCKYS